MNKWTLEERVTVGGVTVLVFSTEIRRVGAKAVVDIEVEDLDDQPSSVWLKVLNAKADRILAERDAPR